MKGSSAAWMIRVGMGMRASRPRPEAGLIVVIGAGEAVEVVPSPARRTPAGWRYARSAPVASGPGGGQMPDLALQIGPHGAQQIALMDP